MSAPHLQVSQPRAKLCISSSQQCEQARLLAEMRKREGMLNNLNKVVRMKLVDLIKIAFFLLCLSQV